MIKGKAIIIEDLGGQKKESIIKNKHGINIGIVRKLDLNKEDKIAIIRIRVFKEDERKRLLDEIIDLISEYVFEDLGFNKLSLIVNPDTDIVTLLNHGFALEGILEEAYQANGNIYNQLIFGINSFCYEEGLTKRRFTIAGPRIELKLLTPEITDEYTDYCIKNKEHLAPFEPLRDADYFTIEAQREILIDDYVGYLNGKSVPFGIFLDDEFIGRIKISNIIYGVFKSASIGYSIDADYQGYGYMQEAVNLILRYAFRDLELNRVEASALTDNIKSQRVLEKCKFEKLGINKNYLFIDGEWRDHATYYVTKNMYE